jgi:PAS domain S-box-containing protein
MRLEKIVNIIYLTGIIALILIGIATYSSFQSVLERNKLLNYSNEVIRTSEKVESFIKDAETGQRGYFITSDKAYLAPYETSRDSLPVYLEKLQQLTAGDVSQQARLQNLIRRTEDKLQLLQESISLKDSLAASPQIPAASLFPRSGKKIMDDIRAIVASIIAEENRLLTLRTAALDNSISLTRSIIYFIILLTVVMACASFITIRRLMRNKANYEQNLHKLNDEVTQVNEELNSSNENLLTTNEELETSNEQLQANNRLLQLYADEINELYNHAPCGYHSTNEAGLILNINDTELTWLGYTRSEVVGKLKLTDIMSANGAAAFRSTYQQFLANGYINNLESEMVRKDGSVFPILVNINSLKDAGGRFQKTHATVFDITELKKVQQKLQESEYHYRLMADNITDMISRHYPDGTYFYVSPSCKKLLGYMPEELQGKSLYDLIHLDDLESVVQSYLSLPEVPEVHTFIYRIRRKDRKCIWFETINRYFKDPVTGQIREVLSVSRDVTQRKEVEEKLKVANLELEQIKQDLEFRVQERTTELHHALQELRLRNHELDNYVYKVSHDLRAPLASILGLVSLSKLDNDISTIKHYIALIENRVNKSDEFIKSVLNHSRILNAELNIQNINFEKIIYACIDELRYMPDVDQVNFSVNIQNREAGFYNDEERLSIIFKNFISNAIKYRNPQAEKSFVRFTINLSPQDAFIQIEDNGVGIEASYLDKIFDMFFRGPIRSEGSGLGLYIVKQTLDRLGGSIDVSSRFNRGTTFKMGIPNLQEHTRLTSAPDTEQQVTDSSARL